MIPSLPQINNKTNVARPPQRKSESISQDLQVPLSPQVLPAAAVAEGHLERSPGILARKRASQRGSCLAQTLAESSAGSRFFPEGFRPCLSLLAALLSLNGHAGPLKLQAPPAMQSRVQFLCTDACIRRVRKIPALHEILQIALTARNPPPMPLPSAEVLSCHPERWLLMQEPWPPSPPGFSNDPARDGDAYTVSPDHLTAIGVWSSGPRPDRFLSLRLRPMAPVGLRNPDLGLLPHCKKEALNKTCKYMCAEICTHAYTCMYVRTYGRTHVSGTYVFFGR